MDNICKAEPSLNIGVSVSEETNGWLSNLQLEGRGWQFKWDKLCRGIPLQTHRISEKIRKPLLTAPLEAVIWQDISAKEEERKKCKV